MSTWASSDDDFFVVRRFQKLGARVILMMQDNIARLEEELNAEDRRAREKGLDCGTFRDEPSGQRVAILSEISLRLREYRKTAYLA